MYSRTPPVSTQSASRLGSAMCPSTSERPPPPPPPPALQGHGEEEEEEEVVLVMGGFNQPAIGSERKRERGNKFFISVSTESQIIPF